MQGEFAAFGRYHGLSGGKLADRWRVLGWAALEDRAGELAKTSPAE